MNSLHTLEQIAIQLGGLFSQDHFPQLVSPEMTGKTAEEIKSDLEKLTADTKERTIYFNQRVEELEAILNKPDRFTLSDAVRDATAIISDTRGAGRSIESAPEIAKELNESYKQRKLSEEGFNSYEDVSAQIEDLQKQRSTLRKKFLGHQRFKSKIQELDAKISSLRSLSHTEYDNVGLAELSYSEKRRFEEMQGDVFNRFANGLFFQYRILLEQLSGKETGSGKMTSAVFESLTDDYISKHFMTKIEQELKANTTRGDPYGRKAVEVLSNSELVTEALAVLREGLCQGRSARWSDSDEVKRRADALQNRFNALPYELKNIIERGMITGTRTIQDEFTTLADNLTAVPLDLEKRKVAASFSNACRYVFGALDDPSLPYAITSQKWDLSRITGEIGKLCWSDSTCFLDGLDMEKWDVFRNNTPIQQLYGKEVLDSFNQLIRNRVFERLLVTPEHTDQSVKLGYKALWFKDPTAVVYDLLNFWRELGYSGEQPFLSIHTSSENTLGAQYVTSLSEEQLREVEQLGIPGVMDVIKTIRQHPDTFRQSQFKEGNEWVGNPVYQHMQEALGKICGHYLENGSEQEKYFAVGVAVDLGFMRFSDKPSKQRDQLIEILSARIGLDDHVQANFKKHHELFLRHIGSGARRSTDLGSYKGDLVALSTYFDDFEELYEHCQHPSRIRDEAMQMQDDPNYIHDVTQDLPNLISYLKAFGTEFIQAQLSGEYWQAFRDRLWKVKEKIFRSGESIDDVAEYVIAAVAEFKQFIDSTNELAEKSAVKDVLKSEQARLLDSFYSDDLVRETAHIPEYFRALDDKETARKFAGKDIQAKRGIEFLARAAYDCNEAIVVTLTREAIRRDTSSEELNQIINYLPRIAGFSGFVSACAAERNNQRVLFDLLYELSTMGEDSLKLASEIDNGRFDIRSVHGSIEQLNQKRIKPTSYLAGRLISVDDRDTTIGKWSSVMDSFAQGNFDSTNELHRNLEYTRFRAIVDHEKVRRHIKNHFTFADYVSIFDKKEGSSQSLMTEQDRFEIDCLAEEARVLRDYVLSVKQRADELGREVFLVPNLSYGYLPVSPIVEELEYEGVKAIIGVKIGSTESHNNKEVVDSKLFKGFRTKIADEQPIIVVVDGTKHLVARDDQDKAARYPDAYQGYLNQVIAMNDAMGFTEVDYSNAGKTDEDMIGLRQNPEFQRLINVYKHIKKTDDPERERKPYQFGLWNTAGIDLIIRNYHQKINHVVPTSPGEIQGPAVIFCNVGLLDEQISQELKDRHYGLTHTPAYFDDSGKIINFSFGFDNFGVRYLNTLETEVKKAFGSMHGTLPNGDFVSSLIRYVQNKPVDVIGYEPFPVPEI